MAERFNPNADYALTGANLNYLWSVMNRLKQGEVLIADDRRDLANGLCVHIQGAVDLTPDRPAWIKVELERVRERANQMESALYSIKRTAAKAGVSSPLDWAQVLCEIEQIAVPFFGEDS
jgi:hypothetical protein